MSREREVVEVHVPVLRATVKVWKDVVMCANGCGKMLNSHHTTLKCMHYLCSACSDSLITNSAIQCPTCGQVTTDLTIRDPFMQVLLGCYPMKSACGMPVYGWPGMAEHRRVCGEQACHQ